MRISNFTTRKPDMADTRTAGSFMKFLNSKPARMGIVANLYEDHTMIHLTESIMNVYSLEKDKKNSFQPVDSFSIEWDLKVNQVKRVRFTAEPEGDGANGSDIIFRFGENYYQKYDTFIIESTRQQIIVLNAPQRVRDNEFIVIGKINDSDYSSVLDTSGTAVGQTTRFITNYMPELHEQGYVKYQSNTEKFRTHISTHRVDVDMSAQYAAMEKLFIEVGRGDKDDPVYELNTAEKDCLDSFMLARNNSCVWGKSNMDVYGKPKIFDELGRPIISGDGVIAQIDRFANNFSVSKMSVKLFNKMLNTMVTKANNAQGNNFLFMVNTLLYTEIQETLGQFMLQWNTVGTFMFSKEAGEVELGATYKSYEFGGNIITFKIERSLDIEYPDRKYGVMLDCTPDRQTGKAAINMFTFRGGELVHNIVKGVGGTTGLQGGDVNSPVAGVKYINFGYAGTAVYNPYRAVVIMGNKQINPYF